jgi:hypothetical protein
MDFPVNSKKKGGDSNRKGNRNNREQKKTKGVRHSHTIYSSKHVRISNEKIEKCKKSNSNSISKSN